MSEAGKTAVLFAFVILLCATGFFAGVISALEKEAKGG